MALPIPLSVWPPGILEDMPTPPLRVSIGQSFGRLEIVEIGLRMPQTRREMGKGHKGNRAVRVRCICGEERVIPAYRLTSGNTRSCGCLEVELSTERIRPLHPGAVHGLSEHPLYMTWANMLARCENPNQTHFEYYGGRGIKVCPEWHDVTAFVSWIENNLGSKPAGYSLDRINNEGDYEPGNVRWATRSEQQLNQRKRRRRK